jgi:hypothetical protein
MDEASCLALVEGLGQRKERTGNEVYYIHVSENTVIQGTECLHGRLDIRNIELWRPPHQRSRGQHKSPLRQR